MAHTLPVRLEDSQDPLHRMRVHNLAEALMPDAFEDAKKLTAEPVTSKIAPQLYAAVCTIEITNDRLTRLEEMRRILLAIIPRERGKTMK